MVFLLIYQIMILESYKRILISFAFNKSGYFYLYHTGVNIKFLNNIYISSNDNAIRMSKFCIVTSYKN